MQLKLLLVFGLLQSQAVAVEESIKVEVTGVLKTGVMAIGGESTGTTITAKGVTWELSLGGKVGVGEVEKFDGKVVTVLGELEKRAGVEIKTRWIVKVAELKGSGESVGVALVVAAKRADSRVEVSGSEQRAMLEVRSRNGIDSATITRQAGGWPEQVWVRLHLKGLESFEVTNRGMVMTWSVASGGDKRTRMSVRQEGKEEVIREDSVVYAAVKVEEGFFELCLPKAVFEGNPESISVRWIDFYR